MTLPVLTPDQLQQLQQQAPLFAQMIQATADTAPPVPVNTADGIKAAIAAVFPAEVLRVQPGQRTNLAEVIRQERKVDSR